MINGRNKVSPTLVCTVFFFLLALAVLVAWDPLKPPSDNDEGRLAFALAYYLTACPFVEDEQVAKLVDESGHLARLLALPDSVLAYGSASAEKPRCYDQTTMEKIPEHLTDLEMNYFQLGTVVAVYGWLRRNNAYIGMNEWREKMVQLRVLQTPWRAEALSMYCIGKLTAGELYQRLFAPGSESRVPALLDIHWKVDAP
jgi:hypothetical protein